MTISAQYDMPTQQHNIMYTHLHAPHLRGLCEAHTNKHTHTSMYMTRAYICVSVCVHVCVHMSECVCMYSWLMLTFTSLDFCVLSPGRHLIMSFSSYQPPRGNTLNLHLRQKQII